MQQNQDRVFIKADAKVEKKNTFDNATRSHYARKRNVYSSRFTTPHTNHNRTKICFVSINFNKMIRIKNYCSVRVSKRLRRFQQQASRTILFERFVKTLSKLLRPEKCLGWYRNGVTTVFEHDKGSFLPGHR